MKNEICYIIGAGEDFGYKLKPNKGDYVIAVDGGYKYLEEAGVAPDMVIGDFDSLGSVPKHHNVIKLNTEKDDTDMLAAVREGLKLGYETFYLLCGTGGRIDHTIANIQVLAFLSQGGKKGYLIDKDNVLTMVTDGCIELPACKHGYVSVFSYSDESYGVSEKGLKYGLDHAELASTFPVGVSNEFVGEAATIGVEKGTLLIIYPKEK